MTYSDSASEQWSRIVVLGATNIIGLYSSIDNLYIFDSVYNAEFTSYDLLP